MDILISEKNFLNQIPINPGVYRFYATNKENKLISELLYVGKAINLRKRVASYFKAQADLSPRISLMVSKITRIEITITDNEVSALILENNLIKSLKPKYNIIFRDDKSYPLIRLSNHQFPRIDSYRGSNSLGNTVFGPYPNSLAVTQSIDMIQRLFKLRTCKDSFFSNRTYPCMLYQIKRCCAPCVGFITPQDYQRQINLTREFLEGKYSNLINNLTKDMFLAADKMEFETAALLRDKITLLRQIQAKQIINNHQQPINSDLIILEANFSKVFIYLIILRNGIYVGDNHFILDNMDNKVIEVMEAFLNGYYSLKRNTCQVHTMFALSEEFKNLFFKAFGIKILNQLNPQLKELYRMGQVNLKKIMDNYLGAKDLLTAGEILANHLGITHIKRMECIDVSHNHGDSALASLVVYENGVIDNRQYRKYNLAREVHGNDLLALEIVLTRRLSSTSLELPQVILLDGGQLQLNVAKNILICHGLYDKIRVVAIFKGERRNPMLDKALFENGLILSANQEPVLFRLLHGLRDEAHRFAITGHRKKQVNKMAVSVLTEIANVGKQKRRALIAHFGSVKAVANANIEELCKVRGIGKALATQIYSYFH